MGTLICWWGQKPHIKVKGHLRSSCKMGWKYESGLTWKVEVGLEPNLVYWYNMGPFVCSCGQRSYTKVKRHQRSSCKMGSKCKIYLIWKVQVRLEPNLVYCYNVRTFTCLWGQRSQMKVKGHVMSICKIVWKCKNLTHLQTLGPVRTMWPHVWDQGQVSIHIIHKSQWQTTLAVRGPQCFFFFSFFFSLASILKAVFS